MKHVYRVIVIDRKTDEILLDDTVIGDDLESVKLEAVGNMVKNNVGTPAEISKAYIKVASLGAYESEKE